MSSKSVALSLVLFLSGVLGAGLTQAQDRPVGRELAAEGDTVWVILNHVKPDKRAQFERFVEEIFWAEAKRLSEADQRVFRQTRVLYPIAPEPDGTYTYFFIMDPVLSGADYDIGRFLEKMYGAEKAEEYFSMFDDATSAPQTVYPVVQSRY